MAYSRAFCVAATLTIALFCEGNVQATALRDYERASSPKQGEILKDAYKAAVADTMTALRRDHFQNGNQKTPDRIERDKQRADAIQKMAPRLTNKQEIALTSLIDQYATEKPDTELENVISSFLLTEANKQIDEGR
jgi:hypothetical protein